MVRNILLFISLLAHIAVRSQNYPSFGPEIKVFISGYTGDAMEPFLSPDGTTLFFNSLNDGVQTRLYYATRVDDSTFTFIGEVNGANEPNNPQLNAVASLDTTGNFVWVSARDYPAEFDNLHRADYASGNCSSVNRVHGNFYIYQPGYIVMDAALTYDGSQLFYCNAFFDTCVVPCSASLGIASKVNDSTFNTIANSSALLQNVNNPAYCVYAPQLSTDGLELYFTRYVVGVFDTEICVSVRPSPADTFSVPIVLVSEFPNTPEAATLNNSASLMYYHKKTNGTYTLYFRERLTTGIEEQVAAPSFSLLPNPATASVRISIDVFPDDEIVLLNSAGQIIHRQCGNPVIDTRTLSEGIYFVQLIREGTITTNPLIIQH
jgi:hypothetical protein